jgi:hypothetical protein
MRFRTRLYPLPLSFLMLSLLSSGSAALASPGHSGRFHRKACGPVTGRHARCHADVVTNSGGVPLVTSAPAGYGAPALRSAYVFPSTNLVANSGFETDTSGWSTGGPGWFINGGGAITRDTSQAFLGAASGRIDTTTAAAYQGASTNLGVLPAGTYSFSAALRGSAGGENTQVFAGNPGSGSVFVTAFLNTSWQTVSGTFTADGVHNVYIGSRGGSGVPSNTTWWTDGFQVVASPSVPVANPGFESDTLGWNTSGPGWFVNGGASITRDPSQAFVGAASGRIDTTTAAAYQGATTDLGVLPAGTYSFSAELRGNAGGEATQVFAGNSGGGTFTNAFLTSTWQTVSGTFTADGVHNVYIGSRGGSSVPSNMTWWTDGFQVVAGSPNLSAGTGQTIAIVDAYDDPNAESDLAVYRSQFSLPPCTSSNGCFRKVNQTGGSTYPNANSGWAQEISLDLDMASAVCPNCKILLVEASSNSFANLGTAEDYAAANANVVSNSYGGSEFSSETSSTYNGHYNHPGVAITVSSGDNGYGAEFPAASQYVTAVGGTSLQSDSSNRGWNETAWSGAGSGCSAYVSKPSWQTDSGCTRRTIADVSAVADPNTGVSVYDTYRAGGWLVFGGTSVSAPLVGSVYALAGNAGSVTYGSFPYSHGNALNDVVSGSNGSCGGSYLCTAGPGYDGPTGLGTPNGLGAF